LVFHNIPYSGESSATSSARPSKGTGYVPEAP
jgi:hypothetical protein